MSSKPIYEIPVTESQGVPFTTPVASTPPASSTFTSAPPTVMPDGSPVSGAATPGNPSAAFTAPPPVAPESVIPGATSTPPFAGASMPAPSFPAPSGGSATGAGPSAPPTGAPQFGAAPSMPAPSSASSMPAPSAYGAPPAAPPAAGSAASGAPAAPAAYAAPSAAPTATTAFAAPAAAPRPAADPVFAAPAAAPAAAATSAPASPTSAPPSPTTAAPAASPAPASAPAPAATSAAAPAAAPAAPRAAQPAAASPVRDEDVADLNPSDLPADPELISALQQVLLRGASDLHVSSGSAPRLRVDGGLHPIPGIEEWDRGKVKAALYSLLDDTLRERYEEKLELDFAYTLSANARFRVNYYQDRGSMGAAFRIIPTQIKTLTELGIPKEVGQFSGLPRGLVLVTGPTGSGKSTTLAALVDMVNDTRADHIVTVEDPIEFMHRNKKSLINQREVGRDTHSFGNALKHVLRQDPDVILIGELRDLETISIALTAAETGHLVFATLHTQSAGSTIDRVIDVFPPHQQGQVRTQLAATLQGVVCQTLVKKAGGSGRAVATEVMFTTPAISNLIREGKTYQVTSVLQAGLAQGMHTMDQALADLVNDGSITRAAAMEKSQDPETLERLITRVDMNNNLESPFVALDADFAAHAKPQGRH